MSTNGPVISPNYIQLTHGEFASIAGVLCAIVAIETILLMIFIFIFVKHKKNSNRVVVIHNHHVNN